MTPSHRYSSSAIERSIQVKNMQISKDLRLLRRVPLLIMLTSFFTSVAQDAPTSFCGKIQIQSPFLNNSNSTESSQLHRMIQCKSQKLYFRTSVGLFPVSFINYTRKFLTISHRHCSSSKHYVSPLLLSAGFPPPPPMLNWLLLFNCSNKAHLFSPVIRTCTRFHASCGSSAKVQKLEQQPGFPHSSCLLVDDIEKLGVGFSPKDFNCSHYSHLHRSLSGENYEEYHELGTRISFDIPDHVPNPCNECQKRNGNCGVGLRCICHPSECKDKVISRGRSLDAFGIVLFSLIHLVLVVVSSH